MVNGVGFFFLSQRRRDAARPRFAALLRLRESHLGLGFADEADEHFDDVCDTGPRSDRVAQDAIE